MSDLVAIGECMVELSRQPDGRFGLAFGGDTFNTAVYAARLGLAVSYATALGDDPYSQGILDLAASEGVDTGAVPRLPGRVPGLYVIETDAAGERTFNYWRDSAPARALFEHPADLRIGAMMEAARCVYFSGITLSLYSDAGLDRFQDALLAARAAGASIAFDGNYRPRGWAGDTARARRTVGRFLTLVDRALPTFDDEAALWGDVDPSRTVERLQAAGIGEIVVKDGANGALVAAEGRIVRSPIPERIVPLDTTAAGDSFNAGYLAARLRGAPLEEAAILGHRLAAVVIGHRGAIVPRDATRKLR